MSISGSEILQINNQIIDDIDLSTIDWNKLSPQEFSSLEARLQEKHKNVKALKRAREKTEGRNSGNTTIRLRGKLYEIKTVLYHRLKGLTSEKSKEALINEIMQSHNPISEI